MTASSTTALHLNAIFAGLPARASSACASILLTIPVRSASGATSSRR